MIQVNKKKELEEVMRKIKMSDVEFSKELNIGLDYNANLHPNAKEEINRIKEFYEDRL